MAASMALELTPLITIYDCHFGLAGFTMCRVPAEDDPISLRPELSLIACLAPLRDSFSRLVRCRRGRIL